MNSYEKLAYKIAMNIRREPHFETKPTDGDLDRADIILAIVAKSLNDVTDEMTDCADIEVTKSFWHQYNTSMRRYQKPAFGPFDTSRALFRAMIKASAITPPIIDETVP